MLPFSFHGRFTSLSALLSRSRRWSVYSQSAGNVARACEWARCISSAAMSPGLIILSRTTLDKPKESEVEDMDRVVMHPLQIAQSAQVPFSPPAIRNNTRTVVVANRASSMIGVDTLT